MIADQHGRSGLPRLLNTTGTVGQYHHGCSRRRRGPHTVSDAPHAVPLVEMGTGADDQRVLAVG